MKHIWLNILVMAVITYLIRMIPLAVFTKKIRNRFIRSFLFYVPYAVLSAMTFPAIFYSTSSVLSACVGTVIALILAFWEKNLITVALGASAAVFVAELVMRLF